MPRSLSPLSVPYRVFQRGGGIAVGLAFVLSGGVNLPFLGPAGPLILLLVAGVAALALVGYETAYVRRFSYELTADTLDIDSGVVSRRSREIPLRRIQNVDISRNVIQRLLGISVVSFETAGGGETEAQLRFVTFEEAKRLQRELARLKRDGSAGSEGEEPGTESVTPESTELFALDRGELAILGALSVDLRVPGALFLLVSTVGSTVVSAYLSSIPGVALVVGGGILLFVVAAVSWIVGAAAAASGCTGPAGSGFRSGAGRNGSASAGVSGSWSMSWNLKPLPCRLAAGGGSSSVIGGPARSASAGRARVAASAAPPCTTRKPLAGVAVPFTANSWLRSEATLSCAIG